MSSGITEFEYFLGYFVSVAMILLTHIFRGGGRRLTVKEQFFFTFTGGLGVVLAAVMLTCTAFDVTAFLIMYLG